MRFALHRFRAERVWDRKFKAYTDLFEALFHIRLYSRRAIARIEDGGDLNDEYMKELGTKAAAGYEEVRKAVVLGRLILGDEASSRLEHLEAAFDDPHYNEDIHEEATADLAAANTAIVDLRRLAKRDLAI